MAPSWLTEDRENKREREGGKTRESGTGKANRAKRTNEQQPNGQKTKG